MGTDSFLVHLPTCIIICVTHYVSNHVWIKHQVKVILWRSSFHIKTVWKHWSCTFCEVMNFHISKSVCPDFLVIFRLAVIVSLFILAAIQSIRDVYILSHFRKPFKIAIVVIRLKYLSSI